MNSLKKGLKNIRELCKRNVPDKHAQWAIEETYVKALLGFMDEIEKDIKTVQKKNSKSKLQGSYFQGWSEGNIAAGEAIVNIIRKAVGK